MDELLNKKDLVLSRLVLLGTLIELLNGASFEDDEGAAAFKEFIVSAGYSEHLLNDLPMLLVIQKICKDLADIDLSDLGNVDNDLD